jgi:hypothetical protein
MKRLYLMAIVIVIATIVIHVPAMFIDATPLQAITNIQSSGSITSVVITGIVVFALYILARFSESFAVEAGKIVAQKLFGKSKKQIKMANGNTKEKRVFVREILVSSLGEITSIKGFTKKRSTKKPSKKMILVKRSERVPFLTKKKKHQTNGKKGLKVRSSTT